MKLLYTGTQIAAALFFMLFGLFFVKHIAAMEVRTVQNLVGTVIPAFPETESLFLQVLGNQTDAQREVGSELLSRCGYMAADFLDKNPFYRQGIFISLCIFAMLFLFSLLIGYHFFYSVKKERLAQEARINILDNAVKYSAAESVIQVRVQTLYNFVRVKIEDERIGIPKEEYNQIFKRFYRGQNKAMQKTEGAGVGLYLSRKILEEQGGTLSVRAARINGSIFVVQLPL